MRNCPVCDSRPKCLAFPYTTKFSSEQFNYVKCAGCSSVFVDPVPQRATFEAIYNKSAYHDLHYAGRESPHYLNSVLLLQQYISKGSKVLDYGCGIGSFLRICNSHGLIPFGVEFDQDAALFARKNADCDVLTVESFRKLDESPIFDAIHLGDVLGHLPDPCETLKQLLRLLKPEGVLFVEGPLEMNPSVVFWVARLVGMLKRFMRPKSMSVDPPTMLFQVDAATQRLFFTRVSERLRVVDWQVYETGWPYANGGKVKRFIATIAVWLSGRNCFGFTFGNRFRAIIINT